MAKCNDFTKAENRDKSPYRAWIVFNSGNIIYIYAYNNYAPTIALDKLTKVVDGYISKNLIKKASIYNNSTNQLIKTIL